MKIDALITQKFIFAGNIFRLNVIHTIWCMIYLIILIYPNVARKLKFPFNE